MEGKNLSPWQWITLIGVIVSAGVGVTVFAFNTFDKAGSSAEVKTELKTDLRRVEVKVDALLLRQGLNPMDYSIRDRE